MFRFKEFVKDQQVTQKELMDLLGISQSYCSNLVNGKLPVSEDKLSIMRKRYGDDIIDRYTYEDDAVIVEDMEGRLVSVLPVSAHGGSLSDFVISVKEQDCEKILSPVRGVDFAITISGDSMAPEYPNGSFVFIKKVNEKRFIDWGRTYVLDTCNGVVVKNLAPSDKGEDFVRCVSVNKDPIYAPFDVAWSDVYGVYQVKLCMSLK